jgi:hypothetical protein
VVTIEQGVTHAHNSKDNARLAANCKRSPDSCRLVPLLVVAPVLRKVKQEALRQFGELVTVHNQLFDMKWILSKHSQDDVILRSPDASSLIDLGASFTVIRQMSLVPIDKPTLLTLTAAAAFPMIPMILLVTPTDQLVEPVLKMLG